LIFKIKDPKACAECTVQNVGMESRQRSAEDIEKHGELPEHQTAQRARVLGLLALTSSTNRKKHIEFMN